MNRRTVSRSTLKQPPKQGFLRVLSIKCPETKHAKHFFAASGFSLQNSKITMRMIAKKWIWSWKLLSSWRKLWSRGLDFCQFSHHHKHQVRESKSCVPCSIRVSSQSGYNNYKQVCQLRCQRLDWGPSICIKPVFHFQWHSPGSTKMAKLGPLEYTWQGRVFDRFCGGSAKWWVWLSSPPQSSIHAECCIFSSIYTRVCFKRGAPPGPIKLQLKRGMWVH